MQNHCDHGENNREGCVIVYDGVECPMCVLERKQKQENEIHKIELSFSKMEDGSCNVFADIFSFDNILQLTAEQAHFVSVKLFTQDDNKHVLLNVPYETLKKFAKDILKENKNDNNNN